MKGNEFMGFPTRFYTQNCTAEGVGKRDYEPPYYRRNLRPTREDELIREGRLHYGLGGHKPNKTPR